MVSLWMRMAASVDTDRINPPLQCIPFELMQHFYRLQNVFNLFTGRFDRIAYAVISILPRGHAIGNIITLRYKSVRLASPDENDGE
jgi:hypothetical protein